MTNEDDEEWRNDNSASDEEWGMTHRVPILSHNSGFLLAIYSGFGTSSHSQFDEPVNFLEKKCNDKWGRRGMTEWRGMRNGAMTILRLLLKYQMHSACFFPQLTESGTPFFVKFDRVPILSQNSGFLLAIYSAFRTILPFPVWWTSYWLGVRSSLHLPYLGPARFPE